MDHDNTASLHQIMVRLDYLYGSKVIEALLQKPEYSFMNRYYYVLYQSIIPNCRIALPILHQFYSISKDMEDYILTGASAKACTQKILNFLLVCLDNEKDYMKFCVVINSVSVMTNLPYRMIAEFRNNGHWQQQQVHPKLIPSKPQPYTPVNNKRSCAKDVNKLAGGFDVTIATKDNFISEIDLDDMVCDSLNQDWLDCEGRQGAIGAMHINNKRRNSSVSTAKSKIHMSAMVIQERLSEIAGLLPTNCYSTICKLRKFTNFADVDEKMGSELSKHDDARVINNLLLSYIINKCAGNVVLLWDALENVVSTSKKKQLQDLAPFIQSCLKTEVAAQSSLQCSVSLTGPVVNTTHAEDQPSASFVSSSTNCVPTKSTTTSDQLLITTSVDVLCSQNMLIYNEAVDICLADIQTKMKLLEDKLATMSLSTTVTATKTTVSDAANPSNENQLSLSNKSNISTVNNKPISSIQEKKGNEIPQFSDLHKDVVPKCAKRWKDLGIQLKIPHHHLDIIEMNNLRHPSHCQQCCKDVLRKWMEITPKPTWNILQKAIDSIPHDENSESVKYLQPPSLPANYIDRHALLNEIAAKLLETTNDPNIHETTVTLTGAGGFGKTMIAASLCHHPRVKEQFTNGFVFIELGPQATEPSVKMSQLYHLLTGKDLKSGDITYTEQEIKQVTNDHYRNLLVVIDDVWHVEDAEPLVKAFSNCKTILTTRMNDIEQYIPSRESVHIGPMTEKEALSLLTKGIIDNSRLSPDDETVLNELAQDVHLWPLLLSLIRGQLSHYLKQFMSYHEAIDTVKVKLTDKGLTAFDKRDAKRSRKLAVKVCIEITLDLLTQSLSEKIKILILWTGIGSSLQTAVLNNLWKISKAEAEETVDVLWHYGLVQFSNVTVFSDNTQRFVEVHAVISHYIVDTIDSREVGALSPFVGSGHVSVNKELSLMFAKPRKSVTIKDHLDCLFDQIKNCELPDIITKINMHTITNPHMIKLTLQRIRECLMSSPDTISLLSSVNADIDLQINECKQILKNAHKVCRKLNQDAQKFLLVNNYDELIRTVEIFFENYRLGNVAHKAVAIAEKIIPYCVGEQLHFMSLWCEDMQTMTTKYHGIKTLLLPAINFLVKALKQITTSLQNGSPDIERTFHYFQSDKFYEEKELITVQYLINLQEVSPNIMLRFAEEYNETCAVLSYTKSS